MSTTTRISLRDRLEEKIANGKKILSVYLTLGYPDLKTSLEVMKRVAKVGADVIEIGIPFSDPMADGPTIQSANQIALNNGFDITNLEASIRELRSEVNTNLVVMTYANILYQFPLDEFKALFHSTQLDGVIIPDVPPEHSEDILELRPIFLVAPNTSQDRIRQLVKQTHGFVYIVSKLGITGGKYATDKRLAKIYQMLENDNTPKLQGFGIDSLNSVQNAIDAGADGIIIGSKLLRLLGDDGNIKEVTKFVNDVRNLLDTM